MRISLLLSLVLLLILGACDRPDEPPATPDTNLNGETATVQTGAQALVADSARQFDGQRLGLIVNHTALVDTAHLADELHRLEGVEVTALFGPEHGIRGTADAGEQVDHDEDERIGAPIYSLYGETRKPTPEMLENVDALVFDIQDIGTRFYTYISTMGLAMQAAAEANLPFYVLDRPNPLGGEYVSGFVLEQEQTSFVGQYAIPVAHGLTVGELAEMIKGEALLSGLDDLQLTVIETEGWQRDMLWSEIGPDWVPPSPNIPDFETAQIYAGACFFEATSASEGRGTSEPFKLLGAPWVDGAALAQTLNGKHLPGIQFSDTTFTPESIPGMAASPKLEGETLDGIYQQVSDPEEIRPVEAGIHVLHAFYEHAVEQGIDDFIERETWLDRLAGTTRLREMLVDGRSPEEIVDAWQEEVNDFEAQREPYLRY